MQAFDACPANSHRKPHPALLARNNLGKSWQLPYQPIRAHQPALTAGVVPAEVFSFALFVVAVCSYAVFWQDFSAISRRLTNGSHGTILEFIGPGISNKDKTTLC